MFYDKKIRYVHAYEGEEKIQNAGFLRMEACEEKVFLELRISKLRSTDNGVCPVFLLGGGKEEAFGEIHLEGGRGCLEKKNLPQDDLAGGIGYEQLEQIYVKMPDKRVLRCMISEEKLHVTWKEPPEPEKEPIEGAAIEVCAERTAGGSYETEERAHKVDNRIPETADKWQYLLSAYPHIRPFEDEREYILLKPQDLVILPEKYFGLTGNSFLLHGFCNYEHLILSKERRYGETVFYIGVPGNFYHKEKQVAVLFGFESFEGKTEPARNGDFGYYMIAVEL